MGNRGMNAGTGAYDRVFRAIGDPHRVGIVELLREKELSAGEILEAIDVVQSTLSHHMKILVEAGVVNASRHGKWTYYSLNTEVLGDAVEFLSDFAKGTKVFSDKTAPSRAASQSAASSEEKKSQSVYVVKEEKPQAEVKKEAEKTAEKTTQKEAEPEITETSSKSEKKKSKKGKKNKKNKK